MINLKMHSSLFPIFSTLHQLGGHKKTITRLNLAYSVWTERVREREIAESWSKLENFRNNTDFQLFRPALIPTVCTVGTICLWPCYRKKQKCTKLTKVTVQLSELDPPLLKKSVFIVKGTLFSMYSYCLVYAQWCLLLVNLLSRHCSNFVLTFPFTRREIIL
jgi:hypothetical protein